MQVQQQEFAQAQRLNQAQPQIQAWAQAQVQQQAQAQALAPVPAYCDGAGAGAGSAGAADIDITEDLMTADFDPEGLLKDFQNLQLGSLDNLERGSSSHEPACGSTCKLVHVSGLHFATGVLVNGSSLMDGLPRLCILTSLVSAPC
jgi:hypothetical protein